MKIVALLLAFLFGSITAIEPSRALVRGGLTGPPSFTGFLDQFTGLSPTWYISCAFKPTNATTGTCATVHRQSDSATLNIQYLPTGNGDVATFTSFCAGTNCFLDSAVDQINGINTTDHSTAGFQPRAIVDQLGNIAFCPQPGSKATTAFNAAVNTAKVHMFVVAQASYADNRASQANVASTTVTGNVTSGSSSLTSMSSQAGISTANAQTQLATVPGIYDSSQFLPGIPGSGLAGQTYLTALPTGTTGTMAFEPGNLSPTGSKTGDTLTFTNAVLAGVWIMNGPTTFGAAYWGAGLGLDQVAGDWSGARNAGTAVLQNAFGQGMRGQFGVYDYDTFSGGINYNAVNLGSLGGGNITYSTNVGMTLFADANGSEQTSQSCFETMVLFPATETQRVTMAQFLMTQDAISFPFAPTTPDGFTWTGIYQPETSVATTVYGAATVGPDALGYTWIPQSPGYTWPSVEYATNINNSKTMWRYTVQQGDADINLTNAERAEIFNSSLTVAPGQHASIFFQFEFESLPNEQGSWCYFGQVHMDNAATVPDLVVAACKGNQAQFVLQCCQAGSTPASQNCGSPFTITTGVVYAVEIEINWSAGGTTDTATVNAGPNGSSLPQLCSVGPSAIWLTGGARSAYLKGGVYRGFPWENAGTIIHRTYNMQFSNTANAFAGLITTQPALPTHP